jgi:hypothetical protein
MQESFQRSVNILEEFNSSNTNQLKILYSPGSVSRYDRVQTLRFYGFLNSLKITVDIKSIPEIEIPDFGSSSNRTQRIVAARDMEWASARKHLELLVKNSRVTWQHVATISLQNRIPYYQVDLMAYLTNNLTFDMGNDFMLGARIVDAGWGKLQNADRVTFFGSVKEEITTIPSNAEEISISQPFRWQINTESQILLSANPQRKQLVLVNNSTNRDITINYGAVVEYGRGITLMRGGGSYEINKTNPYKGVVSAISNGAAILTGIEAS